MMGQTQNKKDIRTDVLFVVREAGVEPARPCEHWHLKPASLPIPPLARGLECTVCSVHEICYHILPPVSTLFFLCRRNFFLSLLPSHKALDFLVSFSFPIYFILFSTESALFLLSSQRAVKKSFPENSCLFKFHIDFPAHPGYNTLKYFN